MAPEGLLQLSGAWAHDESKTHDAGKYQINRSGY